MAANVHIDDIPNEVLLQIFSFLSLEELVNVLPSVNCRWRELSQHVDLWKDRPYIANWGSDSNDKVFFKKAPQLRKVYFNGNKNAAVFRCLSNNCRNITTLQFGPNQKLSYSTFKALADKCLFIEQLTISKYMLSNRKLAQVLSGMLNLKMLCVAPYYYCSNELELWPLVNGCPSLQDLDLDCSFCNFVDLDLFLHAKKDQLISLSARWTMKGKQSITQSLKVCGPRLEKLTLCDYDLLEEEAQSTFEDLQHMTALKEFNAWGMQGPAVSVSNLFMSGKLSTLQILRLNWSSVNDDVFMAICKMCCQLIELSLAYSAGLTDDGLRYIHCCPLLHTLDLSSCDNLGGNAIKYIARCPRIRKLTLDCLDLKKLEPGLNQLVNLRNLCELSFRSLLHYEFESIFPVLRSFRLLKKFSLGLLKPEDKSIANKAESSMPRCEFQWYFSSLYYDADEGGNADGAQHQANGVQDEVGVDVASCRGDVHSASCETHIDECSDWNLFIFCED